MLEGDRSGAQTDGKPMFPRFWRHFENGRIVADLTHASMN
jgi:hypothetical protein